MSINIEEERKVFYKWLSEQSDKYPDAECVWLAAKEHALEMARKGCVLQYDGAGNWWIVILGVMRQGTYATKEEAEQRAVREGLRIDTPETEFLDVY